MNNLWVFIEASSPECNFDLIVADTLEKALDYHLSLVERRLTGVSAPNMKHIAGITFVDYLVSVNGYTDMVSYELRSYRLPIEGIVE